MQWNSTRELWLHYSCTIPQSAPATLGQETLAGSGLMQACSAGRDLRGLIGQTKKGINIVITIP